MRSSFSPQLGFRQGLLALCLFCALGCSEGIILDRVEELNQEEIDIGAKETPEPPKQEFLTLLEKKLNFPYATQTLVGLIVAGVLLGIMQKIYRLTTSAPE